MKGAFSDRFIPTPNLEESSIVMCWIQSEFRMVSPFFFHFFLWMSFCFGLSFFHSFSIFSSIVIENIHAFPKIFLSYLLCTVPKSPVAVWIDDNTELFQFVLLSFLPKADHLCFQDDMCCLLEKSFGVLNIIR